MSKNTKTTEQTKALTGVMRQNTTTKEKKVVGAWMLSLIKAAQDSDERK